MAALPPVQVGLNAHLLNLSGNYRSAGINWYIYHLLSALAEQPATSGPNADFALAVFLGQTRAGASFPNLNLVESRWPTQKPLVRIAWEQFVQPLELRRRGIQLLHAMAFAGPLAISIPWVVTIYDLSFMLYPGSFHAANRSYLKWAVAHSVRKADRVIAISESTRRDLCRFFGIPEEKVAVVYCGADPAFSPAEHPSEVEEFRARRSLPEKMILFVSTLEPRKNVARLIRAFARAKRQARLPHRLVLGGARGWKYEEIDAVIAQEGLGKDVMLAGYVPQDELPLWYQAADLFVYPSLYEGFGLPPLQAMACGVPVVTSDASSLPEVVGDAALKVPADDENALAEAIIRAVGDRALREELSARGLARAALFSWPRAARETLDVYRSVLAERGHARFAPIAKPLPHDTPEEAIDARV